MPETGQIPDIAPFVRIIFKYHDTAVTHYLNNNVLPGNLQRGGPGMDVSFFGVFFKIKSTTKDKE